MLKVYLEHHLYVLNVKNELPITIPIKISATTTGKNEILSRLTKMGVSSAAIITTTSDTNSICPSLYQICHKSSCESEIDQHTHNVVYRCDKRPACNSWVNTNFIHNKWNH